MNEQLPSASLGPIVSSGHLAAGRSRALRVRIRPDHGQPRLHALDGALHGGGRRAGHLALRRAGAAQRQSPGKPKRLADICLVLNVEDTHLVNYSLKKLEKLKLVKGGKAGKEKTVTVTAAGQQACERYRSIRETLLVPSVLGSGVDPKKLRPSRPSSARSRASTTRPPAPRRVCERRLAVVCGRAPPFSPCGGRWPSRQRRSDEGYRGASEPYGPLAKLKGLLRKAPHPSCFA